MIVEPNIVSAGAGERRKAIDALVLAFVGDPAVRRNLYPDARQYLTHFAPFAEAFGGEAFAHGTADLLDDGSGAALWLPPGIEPAEEPLIDLVRKTVAPEQHEETFRILEEMSAHHPKEPHWYLPLVGVDPWHHRRGRGSRLMEHALRRCDRDRALAYLESSNPSNVPFYERHGFTLLTTIRVGATEPVFPMLRRPRG